MTTTEASEPQAATPPKKNVFARIAGVLFAPADAFQEIVRRPDVLAPLVLMLLLSVATTAVIAPRLDFDAIRAMQAKELLERQPGMSQADLDRFGRMAEAGAKVVTWLIPVLSLLFYAIVAGVMLLAFRLMGGEGNYTQALSVTIYAWVPLVLYGIILTIVVAARGTFDPATAASLVKSNPAFLTEMSEQPALHYFLSTVDVFAIWSLILFIFGFSAMSRLSKGTSAAIVIILWAVYVLGRTGLAALPS